MTDMETENLLAEFKQKVASLQTEVQTQFIHIERIWERWELYFTCVLGFIIGTIVNNLLR